MVRHCLIHHCCVQGRVRLFLNLFWCVPVQLYRMSLIGRVRVPQCPILFWYVQGLLFLIRYVYGSERQFRMTLTRCGLVPQYPIQFWFAQALLYLNLFACGLALLFLSLFAYGLVRLCLNLFLFVYDQGL